MQKLIKHLIWIKNRVRIKGVLDWELPCEIGSNTVIDCTGGGVFLEGNNKIGQNCTILSVSTITPSGKTHYARVWLKSGACVGANAVVKQGVVIGVNSILAAGSVAIKNIPDNEIWGGVPAKFLKKRE